VPHIIREISPRLTEEQPVDTPTKNEATHTPGTWSLEEGPSRTGAHDTFYVVDDRMDYVVFISQIAGNVNYPALKANAQLCAAAPELLERKQDGQWRTVEDTRTITYPTVTRQFVQVWKLNAPLAKATEGAKA
jgi:hypothetical protein